MYTNYYRPFPYNAKQLLKALREKEKYRKCFLKAEHLCEVSKDQSPPSIYEIYKKKHYKNKFL